MRYFGTFLPMKSDECSEPLLPCPESHQVCFQGQCMGTGAIPDPEGEDVPPWQDSPTQDKGLKTRGDFWKRYPNLKILVGVSLLGVIGIPLYRSVYLNWQDGR
jgi:hypothetical protein